LRWAPSQIHFDYPKAMAMRPTSSSTPPDPYRKLGPSRRTPDEEVCRCDPCQGLVLCDSLSDNPLRCLECNGEVAPVRIGFGDQLAEDIAAWRSVHRALYLLWLDSGEYEPWARDRLLDPNGSVNVLGRDIVRQLNAFIRTFLWWFQDPGIDEPASPGQCPICFGATKKCGIQNLRTCEACSIVM